MKSSCPDERLQAGKSALKKALDPEVNFKVMLDLNSIIDHWITIMASTVSVERYH
ncbi:MAG: hypothetical protein MI864_06680 [Pseudomonadales bacterium]|nr:hypothetical protein [Pseudomonadales bacterium]